MSRFEEQIVQRRFEHIKELKLKKVNPENAESNTKPHTYTPPTQTQSKKGVDLQKRCAKTKTFGLCLWHVNDA
jgi:hypothetical protein